MASLVGRTITRAEWLGQGAKNPQGDEIGIIWLDDGRCVEFGSWGHDWWGATVTEIRRVDVVACLHCGQPHSSARVVEGGWKYGSPHLPKDKTFAFCDDGHNAAWI